MTQAEQWQPKHTMALRRITSLDVAADGRRVAFTVMQAEMMEGKSEFRSRVYLSNGPGSQAVPITAGEFS